MKPPLIIAERSKSGMGLRSTRGLVSCQYAAGKNWRTPGHSDSNREAIIRSGLSETELLPLIPRRWQPEIHALGTRLRGGEAKAGRRLWRCPPYPIDTSSRSSGNDLRVISDRESIRWFTGLRH